MARCGTLSSFLGLSPGQILWRVLLLFVLAVAMLIGMGRVTVYPGILFYGIQARTPIGLVGVLTAPFLHASWAHLFANLPFVVGFGLLTLLREPLFDFVYRHLGVRASPRRPPVVGLRSDDAADGRRGVDDHLWCGCILCDGRAVWRDMRALFLSARVAECGDCVGVGTAVRSADGAISHSWANV
jgi:hypothetical protein